MLADLGTLVVISALAAVIIVVVTLVAVGVISALYGDEIAGALRAIGAV